MDCSVCCDKLSAYYTDIDWSYKGYLNQTKRLCLFRAECLLCFFLNHPSSCIYVGSLKHILCLQSWLLSVTLCYFIFCCLLDYTLCTVLKMDTWKSVHLKLLLGNELQRSHTHAKQLRRTWHISNICSEEIIIEGIMRKKRWSGRAPPSGRGLHLLAAAHVFH